jgi:CubicO group peptidase (beta-lactamase class C family)
MKPEMVFQIGSITKQFTAISILMLLEEGKLALDDDITKFIPDYPTQGYHISIHHLLTHTSGIKSYTSKTEWFDLWRNDMEPLEMIDFFKNDSLEFEPGSDWAYNNSAYFILGYIIEVASGQTYEDFIENNIFKPLEMNNSFYGSNSEIIKNRAYGYQEGEVGFVNAEYLSLTQPYAAGSIMSTVEDLYRWNSGVHAYKLVKKETLELAFTNHKPIKELNTGYGYGWGLSTINESPTYEHSGGIFGFVSNAIYLPEEDVFVAVLSNCNCLQPVEVSTKMAALAIDKPYPNNSEGIALKKVDLEKWVGVYQYEDSSLFEIITDGEILIVVEEDEKDTLYALSKSRFVFDDDITQFVFEESGDSTQAILNYRLYTVPAIKVDRKMPKVQLSEETLQAYVGIYSFQETFDFNIYIKEGKLIAEMTGQEPIELIPESETVFLVDGVDGKVEFIANAEGVYNEIVFNQGFLKMKAQRK